MTWISVPRLLLLSFVLSMSCCLLASGLQDSVFRKLLRMIFPSGIPVPMLIGLTAPHPAESGRPAKYRNHESGLHGHFAKYGPYDSQEWFPDTGEGDDEEDGRK